jgi:hypothetical protein
MNTILRSASAMLLATVAIGPPVSAFDYPLSSEAIREAYFLGSGDPDKLALFMEKYTKRYPIPKSPSSGYVALIQFETPYLLVAEHVSQNVSSYHAPDAVQEFLGKPAICRIHVEVYWGYNAAPSVNGLNTHYPTDYTVRVKQNDKEIQLKSSWTQSLYSVSSSPVEIGIAFNNEYGADKIHSDSEATVEIRTPDGSTIVDTFDLGSLR